MPARGVERGEGGDGEGDDRKVGCSGVCMGEPPPDPLGGDHSAGLWQRTGAVGEGGPAHPNNTFRGMLQLRRRTGSYCLLHRCDAKVGSILINS